MARPQFLLLLLTTVSAVAYAGEITGKVTGGKGISVVWVEAASGQTFPKPDKPRQLDQRVAVPAAHLGNACRKRGSIS